LDADGSNAGSEFRRRIAKVPGHLREQVEQGIVARLGKMKLPAAVGTKPRASRKPLA
jgi:hypothetical protein